MLPASFFAVAAIALCPIFEAMGELSPGWSSFGTFAGIGYLLLRCGMILNEKLESMEAQAPVRRKGRATRYRRTGRALITR